MFGHTPVKESSKAVDFSDLKECEFADLSKRVICDGNYPVFGIGIYKYFDLVAYRCIGRDIAGRQEHFVLIIIGEISAIMSEAGGQTTYGVIDPACDLSTLSQVFVIKDYEIVE